MKTRILSTLTLSMLLTSVSPVWAQNSVGTIATKNEATPFERMSDLGVTVNPQLGVSSFNYSGEGSSNSEAKLSGGTTFEFGKDLRKLETGVLLLRTGESTFLTIPMMAKLRVMAARAQEYYAKFGFMPAFELSSSNDSATNNIDVLGMVGLGGRLAFTREADFIIETTFNRGLMDAVRGGGERYNQGFLVLAGLSFKI